MIFLQESVNIYSVYHQSIQQRCHYLFGFPKEPIIDRIVNYNTDLENALKCTMISFDSTIMSNLSVGLPIDIVVMDRKKQTTIRKRITKDNEYMLKIRHAWGQLIKENFEKVPAFPLD